jgi:hypothetical protein
MHPSLVCEPGGTCGSVQYFETTTRDPANGDTLYLREPNVTARRLALASLGLSEVPFWHTYPAAFLTCGAAVKLGRGSRAIVQGMCRIVHCVVALESLCKEFRGCRCAKGGRNKQRYAVVLTTSVTEPRPAAGEVGAFRFTDRRGR